MAEDEYYWGKRRIDEDPNFEKARAILKEIMGESEDPSYGEERLRIVQALFKRINSLELSTDALIHWIEDTYEDLLAEKRGPPRSL